MKTYFIIEGQTPHTYNGEPIVKNGEILNYTSYVISRKFFSNCDKKAKRFANVEDAEKYIKRWLQNTGTAFKVVKRYEF